MPAAQAPPLEIRLLGEPEVTVQGRLRALPASKKARALLGYLVTTGRAQRRERLCELLWDGPDDPRAALRWSLAKLRPIVDGAGAARIAADRERVSFERHGAEVDVLAAHALRGAGLAQASTAQLASAAERFRGPFLEGLELSSCPGFNAWCVAEREALRALHVELLTTLIERQRGEPARALAHARALVALDPLAESPRVLVLELLSALGDTRRALDEYDDYAKTLRRELDVKPSLQLERARMALTRAPDASAAHTRAPAAPAAALEVGVGSVRAPAGGLPLEPLPASPPEPGSERGAAPASPFVGRARERARLEHRLETAGDGSAVLLVLGEPGIGKTRLLEELARLTRARGGQALWGRAFEAELVRPYGAFIDALRGAPAQRGSEGLPAPFDAHAADRSRLYAAVLAELTRMARERAPLVVILDDLHWFDEASAGLCHYLARALAGSPVLLAASARAGELADNPAAQRLVRALGRERLASLVELGPLDESELRELVAGTPGGAALERAIADAGGNPLFALEAARADETLAGDPRSLSGLIADRVARLPDADRSLLSWAGALGCSFDVDVLARVSGLGTPDLLASLERLERHAILRSRDTGYDFAHDLLRQAAYRQMSSPRRRLVHAQIARALSTRPDADGALASDIAHHAGLAGDASLAARACITAGHRCLRLFAAREARALAHRGAHLAASLPDAERVTLSVELVAIELLAASQPQRAAQLSALAALAAEARRLGLPSAEARAHFLSSVLHFRADDSQAALTSSLSRIEATRHAGPLELGAELAGAARCCLMLERDTEAAARFLDRARSVLGERSDDIDLVWSEGLLAKFRGDLDAAAARLEHALRVARRERQHWEGCECLLELIWVDLDRGRRAEVLQHAAELASLAERLGESAYAPLAECVRALVGPSVAPLEPGAAASDPACQALAAFEARLPPLRAAGAQRLLAIVLNRAAELALSAGALDPARDYAQQALVAALQVERASECATARVTLAAVALRTGDAALACRHLDELAAAPLGSDLSRRATRALGHLREALASRPSSAARGP
jgi:DNA-binding SARP family transcriptional activator/tetratricopeptide (TPR) repeat protein